MVVQERIAPDAPVWSDGGLPWATSVRVELTARLAGTGQIVVRGTLAGQFEQECRRCLEPTRVPLDAKLTSVFVASNDPYSQEGGVHVYDPGTTLDLSEAIREEAVLALNPYVLCDPECKGLCPGCGTNLNLKRCSCTETNINPAWGALLEIENGSS